MTDIIYKMRELQSNPGLLLYGIFLFPTLLTIRKKKVTLV